MNFLEQSLDGNNQAGKYVLVIIFGFIGGQILGAIPFLLHSLSEFIVLGMVVDMKLVLMLFPFVASFLLCLVLIKVLHRRSFAQVVNGTTQVRKGRVVFGFALWSALVVLYSAIDYCIDPQNFVLQFNWSHFLPLFIVSILLLPIQTTFEEYFLRGYCTQGVAGLTKNRWVAVLVPGFVFGLLHILNPEVQAHGFWIVMPQYIMFGIIFGLMSVLDDGIELAIGAHAANNLMSSLLLTNKDSVLQTAAVFEQLEVHPARDTLGLIAFGFIFFFVLKKKYQWNFSILQKRVMP